MGNRTGLRTPPIQAPRPNLSACCQARNRARIGQVVTVGDVGVSTGGELVHSVGRDGMGLRQASESVQHE